MGRDGTGVKAASKTSIAISFMYQGKRCRERIPRQPTATNLKLAKQHRAAILGAIEADTFVYAETFPNSSNLHHFVTPPPVVETFESYIKRWIAAQEKRYKASTLRDYGSIIKNILIPWLGKFQLTEIKKKNIREKLSAMDVSNKRLANIQTILRTAFAEAVADEILENNPLAGWTYRNKDALPGKDGIDPFSKEEQKKILAALEGQHRNFIQFAMWTGMRTSELIALDWSDINFEESYISVTKAMTMAAKGKAEGTKTRASIRKIKMLAPARAALEAQREHTQIKGKEVFQNPKTGLRWTGADQIRKYLWLKAMAKTTVRYRYPYQCRHTYASMMLSSGEHPMWVAKQMGHSDWTMIALHYGRWMPDADPTAGTKGEDKFTASA